MGDQAEQRTVLAAAHLEAGAVAAGVEHVPRVGERVAAREVLGHHADADRRAGSELWVPPGHTLGLGNGAADLLGHCFRGGVDLPLGGERPVDGHVGRGAELLGQVPG